MTKAALIELNRELVTALKACAHFIENDTGDDPNRERDYFKVRELWRNALAKAGDA